MTSEILMFLLGVHLTMRLIASLYRILDLWYRIADFILPLSRSLTFYALSLILVWWYLEGRNERAFFMGMHLLFMLPCEHFLDGAGPFQG